MNDDWIPAPADPGIEGEEMENKFMDPEYRAKVEAQMKCGNAGQISRIPLRARIEDRIQRLRDEAFRLEHLARELPHFSPEAEDALMQMIAHGNL